MDEWKDYLDRLASKSPVPGGGGASALCGALGTALGEMVANLTTGKKKYAQWEDQTKEQLLKLTASRARLMELSMEDERVFYPLSQAYGIKAETEEEKKAKDAHMENCLYDAAMVPIKVMEECVLAMESVEFMAKYGSQLAVSDAGVAIQFLRAALSGAVMNVYINTKMMKNRERAEEIDQKAGELLESGCRKADAVYGIVLEAVRG